MILREIDARCSTLHLAAAKYDVSVNTIIRWRRIAEKGGYEALYRGFVRDLLRNTNGKAKEKETPSQQPPQTQSQTTTPREHPRPN